MAIDLEKYKKKPEAGSLDLNRYKKQEQQVVQVVQPQQNFAQGLVTGVAKGAGSTLESGVRSGGQIVGGIGGAVSVPIQERQQADLTSQYEQLVNMAKTASPIEKSSLLTKAREIQGQIQKAGQPSKQFAGTFDNPLLAKAREFLQPKTTAEKVGYGAEKIGEYFIPGGMTKQATQGAGLLGRAGAQGIASAGVKLAQTGAGTGERKESYDALRESLKTGAISSAVSAGTELLAKGISAGLEKLGSKIQFASIKPSQADVKDGFNVANIKKHNVGGTLNESLVKTNDRLNEYRNQLQSILKESDGRVDLNKVIKEVDDVLSSSETKNFGSNKEIMNAFSNMYDDLVNISKGKANVDLLTAQDLKIGAGTQGAWQFGKFDPDSKAKEYVYNIFYNKLKTAIEEAAGQGNVKAINKAMSELIPIKNALIRRIPVASRNNPIGLLDGIALIQTLSSGNPNALAFLGAKLLTGSSKAGTVMRDIAPTIGKSEQAGGLLSKFISGIR
jgi:hypothetical protein